MSLNKIKITSRIRQNIYACIFLGMGLPANQVQSHVTLQVISNDVCRVSFSSVVTDRIICTSGVGAVGVCSSDSGGPLSIIQNNQRILVRLTTGILNVYYTLEQFS